MTSGPTASRFAAKATGIVAAGLVAYLASAVFERLAPPAWVKAYRQFMNPLMGHSAGVVPGWAVVETVGRTSGLARQTPVGGRRFDSTFWLVAGDRRSQYVKNICADPKVRVRVHGRWRTGTAHLLAEDDPRRRLWRLNPLNGLFLLIAGTEMVTIRVDLDPPSAARPITTPARSGGSESR